MKRSHNVELMMEAPQLKKAKTIPENELTEDLAELEGEWTTVERRKRKKDTLEVTSKVPIYSELDQQMGGMSNELTKAEKRKRKKEMKSLAKNDTAQLRFMYSNSEILKRNNAIGIEEIRDLVLHVIADAPPPNWLRIDNARLIQKVVTLLIPGITPELLSLPPLPTSATKNPNTPLAIPLPQQPISGVIVPSLPFIASTFSHACPTRAPGDHHRMHSVLSTFFSGPISGEERKKRLLSRQNSEVAKDDPTQYLLTLEQMIENDYPIPSYMADVFEKPPGWVETPEPKPLSSPSIDAIQKVMPKRKIYAIDCEMCMTDDGKELTRVCIIDFHSGIVIYDQLVKPSKPIIDYLTRWSGITAEALAPITTTLVQVQAHVIKLLSPPSANPFSSKTAPDPVATPILLGHSLESDLKALKICHPFCIDTALMYYHPRGRPLKPGLAWLTKKWCGREIQTRGEGGHDPEEDARACLDLLKKKFEGGPGFGEFKIDFESIFERMARSTKAGGGAGSIRSVVADHGNPAVMHGSKATSAIGCKSDEEVVQALLEAIPSHHFAFGRLMSLADTMGWMTPKDAPPTELLSDPSPEVYTPVLQNLDMLLKKLHSSLPSRTALIIFTGHSDPRRMALLNARKMAFESAIRSGKSVDELGDDCRWTAGDGRDLEEAVEFAKRGLLFLGIKP